jgi:hypothetical protein
MSTRPKRLFRTRRRPDPTPADLLAAIQPGRFIELRHWHDHDCPRPAGGPCTCKSGPDLELVTHDPIDPAAN